MQKTKEIPIFWTGIEINHLFTDNISFSSPSTKSHHIFSHLPSPYTFWWLYNLDRSKMIKKIMTSWRIMKTSKCSMKSLQWKKNTWIQHRKKETEISKRKKSISIRFGERIKAKTPEKKKKELNYHSDLQSVQKALLFWEMQWCMSTLEPLHTGRRRI